MELWWFQKKRIIYLSLLSNGVFFFYISCDDNFLNLIGSFHYLKELQVDFVKIDGSFVKNMLRDPMDLVVVRSINEIARLGDVATIAEYVENAAILAALAGIGVDFAQGYHVARPEPLEQMLQGT